MWFYLFSAPRIATQIIFLIAEKMSEGSSSNCLFTFKKRARGGGRGGGGGGMRKRKEDSSASSSSEDETTVVRWVEIRIKMGH